MKLLLIQPPIQDFYDTDIRLQPIGLLYLKATLKKHHPDIDVTVIDFHHGHSKKNIPLPKDLATLRGFYENPDSSPFSTFYHFYHFGADFDLILKTIQEVNPDYIGISSLFTPYFDEVLTISKMIKSWKDIPIIVGGSHPSSLPHDVLRHESIDYIIRGEGERPIVEFFDYVKGDRKLEDVSSLNNNPIKENYPLDEIPFPDYDGFSLDQYTYGKKPLAFMITSRSCPHSCDFCSVHSTFGKSYRRRSVDNILDEIRMNFNRGVKIIDFEDDNLTFNKKEMRLLCEKIIEEFPANELEFVAMNGISYMSLDDELLILMKRAGFTHLNLSLVSENEALMKQGMRPHNLQKYKSIISSAHKLGFKIVAYQILGLPYEPIDSMIQTLITNSKLPVLLGASPFYLPPSSPLAHGKKDVNWRSERLTSMAKSDEVFTLFIATRIINFIKELSEKEKKDKRDLIGLDLLNLLLKEKKLYSQSGEEKRIIKKFNSDLFFQLFDNLFPVVNRRNQEVLPPFDT